jgi:hypothetical protein
MMFIILFNMMYYYNYFRILNMDYKYISSRKISDFSQNLQKFEICKSYILLISLSENIFKGIFLLRGSRRMGKSCQHIMLCFLVHPNEQCCGFGNDSVAFVSVSGSYMNFF